MKIPHFKTKVGFVTNGLSIPDRTTFAIVRPKRMCLKTEPKVRITDARELTPEKAVERVLQKMHESGRHFSTENLNYYAEQTGMTAAVVNGKVRVRRMKK